MPLIGAWSLEIAVPDVPPGRVTFEWALDQRYVIERSDIPQPEFPDSISFISVDSTGEAFTQHYFDSRGVVRVYKMTFDGRKWTLLRDEPDFTTLKFSQRYEGELSADGRRIEGAWETSEDGQSWKVDFGIDYVRSD